MFGGSGDLYFLCVGGVSPGQCVAAPILCVHFVHGSVPRHSDWLAKNEKSQEMKRDMPS